MKLILFATHREAKATIQALDARPLPGEKTLVWAEGVVPSAYEYPGGWIALSGFGIHAAQLTVSKFADKIDEIWSLGLAGALNDSLSIGSIEPVKVVGKYLPLPETIDNLSRECAESNSPLFSVSNEGKRLISTDFPVFDPSLREKFGKRWDLVNMEGYGIAYAAHHLRKKCRMWMAISDFASTGGRQSLHEQGESLSKLLAEHLLERELCLKKS